jgi:hypothetical protein
MVSWTTLAWSDDWRLEEVLIVIEESRSLKLLSLKFVKVVFGLFFGSRLILGTELLHFDSHQSSGPIAD